MLNSLLAKVAWTALLFLVPSTTAALATEKVAPKVHRFIWPICAALIFIWLGTWFASWALVIWGL